MKTTMKILMSASALVLAGGIASAGALAQQSQPAPQPQMMMKMPGTISVTGTGEASAKPDMATVNFSVEARGATAAAALSNNNKQMNDAMAAMKKAGVAEKDMQTTGLYLNSVNKPGQNGSWSNEIDYYNANNTLTVKVRKIDDSGKIIDAALNAGINGLGGISYGFSETDELMQTARTEAVKDAREKAMLYAAAAGVQLGKIMYITEPGSSIQPPMPMMNMRMDVMEEAAYSTNVAAGENTVTARVTIVYAIAE